jgi:FKBP-type peptidyl-prolyl cis-trans isomerase FkpA
MRASFFLLTSLVLSVALSACTEAPSAPTNSAPYSQTDLKLGSGPAAASGDAIIVEYVGWLYDSSKPDNKGPVFDTSIGGDPFSFVLGAGEVVDGWDKGIVGMREGGKRRLVIPPSLAYGPNRNALLPPYATLVFEIDLVGIAQPAQ